MLAFGVQCPVSPGIKSVQAFGIKRLNGVVSSIAGETGECLIFSTVNCAPKAQSCLRCTRRYIHSHPALCSFSQSEGVNSAGEYLLISIQILHHNDTINQGPEKFQAFTYREAAQPARRGGRFSG